MKRLTHPKAIFRRPAAADQPSVASATAIQIRERALDELEDSLISLDGYQAISVVEELGRALRIEVIVRDKSAAVCSAIPEYISEFPVVIVESHNDGFSPALDYEVD